MSFVNYTPAADLLAAATSLLVDWAAGKNLTEAAQRLNAAVGTAQKEVAETRTPEAQAIIAQAREQYADNDLEIDDEPAVDMASGGCWVQAWVWVSKEED